MMSSRIQIDLVRGLAVGVLAGLTLIAVSAADDPFDPFRPTRETGEPDPFAPKPVSVVESKDDTDMAPKPEMDPSLEFIFRIDSGLTEEEKIIFKNLSPGQLDRVRTHFLERLNVDTDDGKRAAILTVGIIVRKLIQWDSEGIEYNRDNMIESILSSIKTDDPRRIMSGIWGLEGLKDARVHAYIASFLDHEIGVVRRTAERVLSTTKPEASSPENTHSPVASGREEKSEINGDETEEATGKGMSIEWLLTGAVVVAGIALFFWLLTGKNRRSSKT